MARSPAMLRTQLLVFLCALVVQPAFAQMIGLDDDGKPRIRAIKLAEALHLDGKLNEQVYDTNAPFGELTQVVPRYGAPISERTDLWVMYDTENIYVTCRCWDSAPPDKWIANELRRDTNQLRQNDHIGVMFDTFYDRRSGFLFYTNPLGARADYSVVDEGALEHRLEPGLDVEDRPLRRRLDRRDGDSVQVAALPFGPGSGLGHPGAPVGPAQERVGVSDAGAAEPGGPAGVQPDFGRRDAGRTRAAAGRQEPRAQAVRDLAHRRPTGCARRRCRTTSPAIVGVDVKYGITANLTADFTDNTDFAQVEIDEQQVNLTRFSLFFPEKRDFFLEGHGIFDFGRGGVAGAAFSPTVTDQHPAVPVLQPPHRSQQRIA